MTDSAREVDANGYITIEKNPISRVGVFPYLGRNISPDCDPDRVYNVLRPAEELGDPETMKSFELIPLVDDHTMLGQGFTAPEEKGVHGWTGEKLTFEDGVLYSPLRIVSEKLKSLIATGKKELSLGYRVREWQKQAGVFNGKAYDFIQRGLRGNHVALVAQGRCGPEVAVLDHLVFDSMEINVTEDTQCETQKSTDQKTPASESQASPTKDKNNDAGQQQTGDSAMAEEEKKEEKGVVGLKDVHDFIKDNKPMWDKVKDMMKDEEKSDKAEDADEDKKDEKKSEDADTEEKSGETKIEDAEEGKEKDMKAKDESEKKDKEAMDAAIDAKVKAGVKVALDAALADLQPVLMKTMAKTASERDALAREIASIVGTFDHAEKTTEEVLAYGLEKVGLKAPKGQEQGAWAGFMAGRKKQGAVLAFDSKQDSTSLVEKTLAASK